MKNLWKHIKTTWVYIRRNILPVLAQRISYRIYVLEPGDLTTLRPVEPIVKRQSYVRGRFSRPAKDLCKHVRAVVSRGPSLTPVNTVNQSVQLPGRESALHPRFPVHKDSPGLFVGIGNIRAVLTPFNCPTITSVEWRCSWASRGNDVPTEDRLAR